MNALKSLRLPVLTLAIVGAASHPGGAQTSDRTPAHAVSWQSVGPDGGDARSFAADPVHPNHIYMGTTSGWIYQTEDGGSSWTRLARLGSSYDEDLVLDNIVVDEADPNTLFVGAWVLDRADGGLFISHDSGATWRSVQAMRGQSIRALAQAPSDRRILVAGTLRGVYRSEDGGVQWTQISPPQSLEIHEVESVAIDPNRPDTIYAGTWHLPWKTTDGGATWHSIKDGLIVDSDVFSIIIDPVQTNVVYTSACSGIYRSDNGGELYHKVQGIPTTARRTRVLLQDPVNRQIVYAGTTEGLYKTEDGGVTWSRMTGADVIINDIRIDPRNTRHVLLATDRSGVLRSEDGAVTFQSSNRGFSQRQVAALLVAGKGSQTLYAGVLNDKDYGGVFVSSDGGSSWSQQSAGLGGRDVYTLAETESGALLAGTNQGVFRWDGSAWSPDSKTERNVEKTSYVVRRGKKTKVTTRQLVPGEPIAGRVNRIVVSGDRWYAAGADGVYTSVNRGAFWQGGPVLGRRDLPLIAAQADTVLAGDKSWLALSRDGGVNWQELAMPEALHWLNSVAITPDGQLWLGAREGVFLSADQGQSWQAMATLPISDINAVRYDPDLKRVVVTSANSSMVLAVDPAAKTWKWWDAGWTLHSVHSVDGRLVAATRYSGVVMEPSAPSNATTASAATVGR